MINLVANQMSPRGACNITKVRTEDEMELVTYVMDRILVAKQNKEVAASVPLLDIRYIKELGEKR